MFLQGLLQKHLWNTAKLQQENIVLSLHLTLIFGVNYIYTWLDKYKNCQKGPQRKYFPCWPFMQRIVDKNIKGTSGSTNPCDPTHLLIQCVPIFSFLEIYSSDQVNYNINQNHPRICPTGAWLFIRGSWTENDECQTHRNKGILLIRRLWTGSFYSAVFSAHAIAKLQVQQEALLGKSFSLKSCHSSPQVVK